jgi:D-alanyl-D-alanine-carboxypeptidase/D-alanyl-D-alanine-endopeptidase
MSSSIEQVRAQLKQLVAPYLKTQPAGLGFAIGYASPELPKGDLFFVGSIKNQFGSQRDPDRNTPFAIASVTKTFTATLYALLIRASDRNHTVGEYGLPISRTLGGITLDSLVNYTSGLPPDNEDATSSMPPYWPRPYSMAGLLSYLSASPPELMQVDKNFTYSNLAFSIMGAILSLDGGKGGPSIDAFVGKMRERIFKPLGLQAAFFDEVSLADLPRGYYYDYTADPLYAARRPGWDFFPAYYGAGGVIASANDMLKWLLFNMGLAKNEELKSLLRALHAPSTGAKDGVNNLGLGWFINPKNGDWLASVWKDGGLDDFSSYIAFAPSEDPGPVPSRAGAFVLVNARGVTHTQTKDGTEIGAVLTNDLLHILQGKTPPTDKSGYPTSVLKGS